MFRCSHKKTAKWNSRSCDFWVTSAPAATLPYTRLSLERFTKVYRPDQRKLGDKLLQWVCCSSPIKSISTDIINHHRNASPCIAAGLLERTDQCSVFSTSPSPTTAKTKNKKYNHNVSVLSLYRVGTGDGRRPTRRQPLPPPPGLLDHFFQQCGYPIATRKKTKQGRDHTDDKHSLQCRGPPTLNK